MRKKTLTNTFISMLCTELAMLLDAGLTLNDSIQIMLEDEPTKDAKEVLQTLLEKLETGEPFAATLKSSGYFPHYMTHMVEIGEKTGRLVETLRALSLYYDRQTRLSQTVKSSVLYPAILLILMVAVVVVLIVRVLPIFNDIFTRLGTQMSSLAVTLMNFGTWLGNSSIVIAIIAAIIFIFALLMWLIPGLRKGFLGAFMNRWGARGIFGEIASSRFTSAMTLAMASGIPAEEAVGIASALSGGSKAVDKQHEKCTSMLQSGSSLSDAMCSAGILSPQDGKMLSIGNKGGQIDTAMAEIARRNDISVQDEIDRIVARVEPTLVIISSIIVGIILLSVMMPLMGIMTSIG